MYLRLSRLVAVSPVLVFVLTTGCQCGDTAADAPWRLDDDPAAGTDASPDTTARGDTSPTTVCRGSVRFDIRTVRGHYRPRNSPVVDGRAVFAQRGLLAPDDARHAVFQRFRPNRDGDPFRTDLVRSTSEDDPRYLYAARAGRILVKGGNRQTVHTLDDTGERIASASFTDNWVVGFYGPTVGGQSILRRSLHRFDGTRFAFRLYDITRGGPPGPPSRPSSYAVGYHDGEQSHQIERDSSIHPPVTLLPDGVAFVGRTDDGDIELFRYRPGDGIDRVTRTDAEVRGVASTAEAVFWNTREAVYTADPQTLEPTTIHEGPCGHVDADGERAVFACETEPAESTSLTDPIFGTRLFVWDGTETHPVPSGGAPIGVAKLHGPHVVWAEGPPAEEDGDTPTGELRYWRRGTADSVRLARFTAPRPTPSGLTDDAPPVTNLSIGDGVIAWLDGDAGDGDTKHIPGLRMAVVHPACEGE